MQELGTSLDFSQIYCKVTFYSKEQRNFVTISTKVTSVNEYQNIFQFSEVALASGISALTAELMPWKDVVGDQDSLFSMPHKETSLDTFSHFFVSLCDFEETPQCQNLLLFPGWVLCWDARLNVRWLK